MAKWRTFGIIILLCLICVILFYRCKHTSKIDITEVDSIRMENDTIIFKIDSINKALTNINVTYEEDKSVIINQPLDSDILFFSRYLSKEAQ